MCTHRHTPPHTHTHTQLLQEGPGGSGQQVVLQSPSCVLNFPTSPTSKTRLLTCQMINTACVEGREREVCVKFWYRPHSHHTPESRTLLPPRWSPHPRPHKAPKPFLPLGISGPSSFQTTPFSCLFGFVSSTQHQLDTHYMLYINTRARVNSALIFLVSCNFNDPTLLYPILTKNIPESITTASGKLPVRPGSTEVFVSGCVSMEEGPSPPHLSQSRGGPEPGDHPPRFPSRPA